MYSITLPYLLDQSLGGGLLYACYGALLFLLDLAAGERLWTHYSTLNVCQRTCLELPPVIHAQGKPTMVLSRSSGLEFFPQLQRTLTVPQTSLHSLSLSCLLCTSCSVGSGLSLRRKCYRDSCTFDVLFGGSELSVHLSLRLQPGRMCVLCSRLIWRPTERLRAVFQG